MPSENSFAAVEKNSNVETLDKNGELLTNEVRNVPHRVSFAEAFRFWVKLGFISFGGPAGQIAIMHKELVDKRRWLSDERFLHALNYCMLLPGPEAQQLAIYIGWLMHRTIGGLTFCCLQFFAAFLKSRLSFPLIGSLKKVRGDNSFQFLS